MAGTNYVINPVKATCMKYSGRDNGIQGLNDTCFGICAAFSGTYDTFAMDPKCTQACTDFIEQRKREIFGVGSCDHQVPYRPVAWQQIPRYVPELLRKKGIRVEDARKMCKNLCDTRVPLLATECRQTCDLDANAVEEYPAPQGRLVKNITNSSETSQTESKKSKESAVIWVAIALIVIIFLVLLYLKRK